jgi:serine phosphatase RsbU (regulator of sigma subunit)
MAHHNTETRAILMWPLSPLASVNTVAIYRDNAGRSGKMNVPLPLPQDVPELECYELHATTEVAGSHCGDFYDFLSLANGQLVIVVGDIAGIIGPPIVKVLDKTKVATQSCFAGEVTPAFAVAQLNRRLCGFEEEFFVVLLAVALDPATHTLNVINGGHFPPILRSAKGDVEDLGKDNLGLPLGVLEDVKYQHSSLHLQPGDSLILFTDGIVDATNANHEAFGLEKIEQLVAASDGAPKQIVDLLLEHVQDHMTGTTQDDDITLVCIQRRR